MGAINPFTNFGFRKIFGEEASKDILISFLNTVLQRDTDITEIQFQDKEKNREIYRSRRAIYDIYCTDAKGNKFIVEMQNTKQMYFKDRTAFYATFPIVEQAQRGDWNFSLEPVYCIGLLGFNVEKDSDKYFYKVKLKDQYNEICYDKITFIYIELPKFQLEVEGLKTNLEKWLYFLKYIDEFDELPSILDEPIFKQVFETLNEEKLTLEERNAYEESLKAYRDNINVIDTALREGREEGIKEVIEKVRKDMAQKLIRMEIDLNIIAQGTGLSVEEIKVLQEKIKNL